MSKEIKNNLSIKIFALIIAIILWSYVMSEENPIKPKEIRNVKVQLTNTSSLDRENLMIISPEEAKVNIRVKGKVKTLNDLSGDDFIVTADLSGYKEGDWKVPVYVEVPSDVKLVDYSPKEILFKFEKIIKEDSTVKVETTGELPKGYVLGEPEVKPQSIYIEGPRSWVNSVSEILATVDITDKTEDIKVTRPIRLLDGKKEDVRGVKQEQSSVEIFIPIYQTKKVPVELQTEGELPDNYDIMDTNIDPSTIEIKGKKEVLRSINIIRTKTMDINSLIGKRNVLVELEIPENVELVDPNQKVKVTLNIDESKTKTFNYTLRDVNIKNLGPELKIAEEDLDQIFEVKVVGLGSKIDELTKEDLSIEIDLKDLEEGEHRVSLLIQEQTGIKSIEVIPETLNIKLLKE